MGGDDHLLVAAEHEPDQAALEVRVHVYVWLVTNRGSVVLGAREEPHELKPHLETVSHDSDLAHERAVSDEQLELSFVPDADDLHSVDSEVWPGRLRGLLEGVEIWGE